MYFIDDPLRCATEIVFFERKSDRKKSFLAMANGAYCSLKSTNFKRCERSSLPKQNSLAASIKLNLSVSSF